MRYTNPCTYFTFFYRYGFKNVGLQPPKFGNFWYKFANKGKPWWSIEKLEYICTTTHFPLCNGTTIILKIRPYTAWTQHREACCAARRPTGNQDLWRVWTDCPKGDLVPRQPCSICQCIFMQQFSNSSAFLRSCVSKYQDRTSKTKIKTSIKLS